MRVNNHVLRILSGAAVNGNALVLPDQLERAMYVAVNKVLEAAGWKWDRKAKAHTCEGDAVDVLEQVLLTGEVTVAKNEFGYFPTPKPIVAQLIGLAELQPGMAVLEPSAGQGAIAAELCRAGVDVDAFELLEANIKPLVAALRNEVGANAVVHSNFLVEEPAPVYDRVVMNPPFSRQQDIKHVMHAFKFLKPGGRLVSVMSASITFRTDKLTQEFHALLSRHEGGILPLPAGAFRESGTLVSTVIVTLKR
jgi:predicted RNA methylase